MAVPCAVMLAVWVALTASTASMRWPMAASAFERDVRLGEIGGADFYISAPQFAYWKHTQLIIDVVPGRGGMFSLENGEGVRFLVRSRLFTDEEFAALSAAGRV